MLSERIAGLARLHGAVEFQHPWLTIRHEGWDAAFCEAVGRSLGGEDHRSVVQGLLDRLNDPRTNIFDSWPESSVSREGEPVVEVDGVPFVIAARAGQLAEFAKLVPEKGPVVYDLRGAQWWSMLGSIQIGILASGPVTLPGTVSRFTSGYPGTWGSQSYSAGVHVTQGSRSTGTGERRPIVVIVDVHSGEGTQFAAGLQRAGLANVVWDGRPYGANSTGVDAGGGVSVGVCTMEYEGFWPDVHVRSASASDYADATCVQAALSVLRDDVRSDIRPELLLDGSLNDDGEVPSGPLRVLALSRAWNVFEHAFPYHHLLDRPWSEVLGELVEEFVEAGTAGAYGIALAHLAVRTQDSHSFVMAPGLWSHIGTHMPPIALGWIEGQSVVLASEVDGVQPGDVVVSIDGVDVEERRHELADLIAHSTEQALRHRMHQQLLAGAKESTFKLGLDRGVVEVTRSHPWYMPPVADPAFGMLDSGFGYFHLAKLEPGQQYEAFEHVRHTPALILDVRCYPQNGMAISTRLTSERVLAAQFRRRETRPDIGDGWLCFEQFCDPAGDWTYEGRVVALINEAAISHAEHSCLWLEAATDVTFIGSPTQGANGDVTQIPLPGNARITMTGHDVRHADGRQLQRVGIQPHIEVRPTIEGIRAGRDEVLEAAIAFLQR